MNWQNPHTLHDLKDLGRKMDDGTNLRFGIDMAANLLHVRSRSGEIQTLKANPAQQQFESRRARQNIVLKARQMGMTTWIAGRFFLRTITHPGTLTLQVAHTREAAQSLFRVVQRMWEQLPDDLREGPLKRSRSNVRQMIFPALDSEFLIASAAEVNAGRGLSVQNLHCSEVARWPGNAAEKLAGLRAALSPTGELCLESTPNGAYGAFYDEWSAASGDPNTGGLIKHFLPWWLEPAYKAAPIDVRILTEEEQSLQQEHHLSAEQIGFRRNLARSYGALRSQEFAEDPETCFRATGACCFDIDAIEQRLKQLLTDQITPHESRRGGALLVWFLPQPNREYIVAVDTAGGGDTGDFAAIQVIELNTGLQCAELQQRLTPADTAQAAAALAREYNQATLVVERNNHGAAVLAYLDSARLNNIECYKRLYKQQGQPGWLTTSASKPEMIARLGVLLTEAAAIFTSRRLLAECRTYLSATRGRTVAATGSHDDLVMSMAIAQSVRAELLTLVRH